MLKYRKSKINKWIDKSIGTVHTFQGKEAQKVYFVVGTDNTQDGAVNWSCEKLICLTWRSQELKRNSTL